MADHRDLPASDITPLEARLDLNQSGIGAQAQE
jgi:hypothetical protein